MTKKRRKPTFSSTAQALADCRAFGWAADKTNVVEQTISAGKLVFKRDFLAIADIVVLDGRPGAHAVQATVTNAHLHHRMAKCAASPHLVQWLRHGNRFSCWTYRKLRVKLKDGDQRKRGVAFTWEPRRFRAVLREHTFVEWEEVTDAAATT